MNAIFIIIPVLGLVLYNSIILSELHIKSDLSFKQLILYRLTNINFAIRKIFRSTIKKNRQNQIYNIICHSIVTASYLFFSVYINIHNADYYQNLALGLVYLLIYTMVLDVFNNNTLLSYVNCEMLKIIYKNYPETMYKELQNYEYIRELNSDQFYNEITVFDKLDKCLSNEDIWLYLLMKYPHIEDHKGKEIHKKIENLSTDSSLNIRVFIKLMQRKYNYDNLKPYKIHHSYNELLKCVNLELAKQHGMYYDFNKNKLFECESYEEYTNVKSKELFDYEKNKETIKVKPEVEELLNIISNNKTSEKHLEEAKSLLEMISNKEKDEKEDRERKLYDEEVERSFITIKKMYNREEDL